jgi:uncharacterized protein (DUF1330 family)
MSAYIIVGFTPKDKEKLLQYGASVVPTLKKSAGEIIVKGPAEQLHGNNGFEMQVIIAFPTKEDASAWYHSKEYQALIPIRDAGMDSQFQLIG